MCVRYIGVDFERSSSLGGHLCFTVRLSMHFAEHPPPFKVWNGNHQGLEGKGKKELDIGVMGDSSFCKISEMVM